MTSTWQKVLRDTNAEMVMKIVPVRAVNLSTGPFCTEFQCEQLCNDDIFWDLRQLLGPETQTLKLSQQIAAVRAVNFSIGPFCTEFRCEQLCDDEAFWHRGQENGNRGR